MKMTKEEFILKNLSEYQRLNFELKYELITRIPLAVGRGEKARVFEEIANKYSVTVQCCRNLYYNKKPQH